MKCQKTCQNLIKVFARLKPQDRLNKSGILRPLYKKSVVVQNNMSLGHFVIQLYNYLQWIKITIFYRVQCTLLYIENDAEIFPAHYTWKVAKIGFEMAFMMNKL